MGRKQRDEMECSGKAERSILHKRHCEEFEELKSRYEKERDSYLRRFEDDINPLQNYSYRESILLYIRVFHKYCPQVDLRRI